MICLFAMMWRGLVSALGVAALLALPAAAVAEENNSASPCTLEPGPVRTVTRIVDGETLVLDDGKVVRLIGALAPRARDANASPGAWPPEIDTIKALSDLVLAKKIKLAFAGRRADRYGRALAQVFLEDRGREEWVQGTLLANGYARAYGLPESFGCARELLAHEAEARRKRLGALEQRRLSRNARGPPGRANEAAREIRAGDWHRRVRSRTKGATYLNFSNDWRTDFTARIDKKVLAANPEFDRFSTASRIRLSCFAVGSSDGTGPSSTSPTLRNLKFRTARVIPPTSASKAPRVPPNRCALPAIRLPEREAQKNCARLRRKVRNRAR
jgi:endonuclease YncB( thermonuclease family)